MAREREPRPKAASPGEGGAHAPTFEERLAALEAVVRDLEQEDLPLEVSIERYREGVAHLEACRALLDGAERRLAELVPGPGGQAQERPLAVGEGGLEPAGES